jgi:transposase
METETLVDLLLGESPREAALRTLEWIRAHSQARSVSLWRQVNGAPALELGAAVDEQTIAGVKGLLARAGGTLLEGQPVRADGSVLVTVDSGSGDSHLLYVDGLPAERRDVETMTSYARVALKALRHPAFGTPRLAEEAKREELVALLRLHEWNIARVARARNVTRKTIYEWLRKFNISRERVAKA